MSDVVSTNKKVKSITFAQLKKQGLGFAVFPEVRIYDKPAEKSILHLIFGCQSDTIRFHTKTKSIKNTEDGIAKKASLLAVIIRYSLDLFFNIPASLIAGI